MYFVNRDGIRPNGKVMSRALISSRFFTSIQGFQAMLGRFTVRLELTELMLNLLRSCRSKYCLGSRVALLVVVNSDFINVVVHTLNEALIRDLHHFLLGESKTLDGAL